MSALIIQRGTITKPPRGPEESQAGRENRDALIRSSEEKSSTPKLNFRAAVHGEFLRGSDCSGSLHSPAALRHPATLSTLENCCLSIIPFFLCHYCWPHFFPPRQLKYHASLCHRLPLTPPLCFLQGFFFFSPC